MPLPQSQLAKWIVTSFGSESDGYPNTMGYQATVVAFDF